MRVTVEINDEMAKAIKLILIHHIGHAVPVNR